MIVNLAVGLFVGLSSGASVILAQFYGAKDDDSLEKTLHTAFAFSIIGSIVLGVIGYAGSRWMLQIMDTPADVLEDSVLYLHIYFIGMLFNLLYNMGAGILRAVGDSKCPLYVLIITCNCKYYPGSSSCDRIWSGRSWCGCCNSDLSGDQCGYCDSNAAENERKLPVDSIQDSLSQPLSESNSQDRNTGSS